MRRRGWRGPDPIWKWPDPIPTDEAVLMLVLVVVIVIAVYVGRGLNRQRQQREAPPTTHGQGSATCRHVVPFRWSGMAPGHFPFLTEHT